MRQENTMNERELFSEIYGCYFTVVARVLEQAREGLSRPEIEKLVLDNAFYDSAFHLLPKLFSGEWDLLKQNVDGRYGSKLQASDARRPMSTLERSWIKSLLLDKRIALFVSPDELASIEEELANAHPLFLPSDFHLFDIASDGDPYGDEQYQHIFRTILHACSTQTSLFIDYESGRRRRLTKHVRPYKICYSNRDDKFRMMGLLVQQAEPYREITLNLGRIRSVQHSNKFFESDSAINAHLEIEKAAEPIVLEVSTKRNALERCMLQFASWEKQTEYDEDNDCYLCKIFFDPQDETELLIRVLSFGPVVKVLGPDRFLSQVRERVYNQFELNKSCS